MASSQAKASEAKASRAKVSRSKAGQGKAIQAKASQTEARKANPRQAKATESSKSRASAPPSAGIVLTAAAWSEADLALAEALQGDIRATTALGKVRRSAARAQTPALAEAAEALELEMFGLRQALARALKQRGFHFLGKAGDEVRFDPRRHRLVRGEALRGAPVRIVIPGVAAGDRVLAPAEVRRMRKVSP